MRGKLAGHYQQIQASSQEANLLDLLPELQAQQTIFAYAIAKWFGTDAARRAILQQIPITAGGVGTEGVKNTTRDENDEPLPLALDSIIPPDSIKAKEIPHSVLMDLHAMAGGIVNTATKIVRARNDTALTRAEVNFFVDSVKGIINDFIPDPDRRRAFIHRLMELAPGRAGAPDGQIGEGGD